MAPLLSEFRDAAVEQAFLRQHLGTTQSQLRIAFIFCSIFYLGFTAVDVVWLGFGPAANVMLAARLSVVIIAFASLALLRIYPESIPVTRLVATGTEIAGSLGFLVIFALRPREFQMHAITMAILIIVLYIYVPNRLVYVLAVAVPVTLMFVLLAHRLSTMLAIELGTTAVLLMLANVFGYVAARRYQLLWREEYRAQVVLKNLSIRDPLTGCYNRRHLHEQLLENEISRAQRYGLSLTVIMCDLDHFKSVNDNYGHYGGDAVLLRFAGLLRSMTRDSIDSVVRYGGEEFLLILPETDLNGAVLLAERLRQTFAGQAIDYNGQVITATASFGVASVNFSASANPAAHHGMIATADNLLYAAKKGGRNQVCSVQLP
ncbi:diguanylate cyclase [Oxalobacteraceae bacterium]|nr:diguanylate cyclase [Oxalobacteraceae bacterium]